MNSHKLDAFHAREEQANAASVVNPHLRSATPGVHSRAYTNFPAVNWAWAASNASFDWMDWHLPPLERFEPFEPF
jgi:hypothetical protein